MHGVWLDLVNLRSESYAADSRIPEMTFGTAADDAKRRDLTINALFYNLHTREVEDLTGRGLEDLRKGVVRTPLAPRTTFLDDPLRVLRAVRFAHRFRFAIDPELLAAAAEPEVREALRTKARSARRPACALARVSAPGGPSKSDRRPGPALRLRQVSKERVGIELEGMLRVRPLSAARRDVFFIRPAPARRSLLASARQTSPAAVVSAPPRLTARSPPSRPPARPPPSQSADPCGALRTLVRVGLGPAVFEARPNAPARPSAAPSHAAAAAALRASHTLT